MTYTRPIRIRPLLMTVAAVEEKVAQQVSNVVTCQRCGHSWEPRVDNPKACPRCKRYDYK